jgi:hypothetical protein
MVTAAMETEGYFGSGMTALPERHAIPTSGSSPA